MRNFRVYAAILAGWMAIGAMAAPAAAETKSKTVTVSCVIEPQMELQTPARFGTLRRTTSSPAAANNALSLSASDAGIGADSNMNGRFRLTENVYREAGAMKKTFTLTAL